MARDLIIGLGTNCELTHNLRRAFGLEEAYPFDWWITPLPALASLIENGFDFAIEDDNLALTDNGMSVLNRRWRILHHHDFPRRDGRIRDDWRDVIPETARKYEALAHRLDQRLGAATTATVFINGNGGHEYLTPDERFACSRPGLYEAVLAAARRR